MSTATLASATVLPSSANAESTAKSTVEGAVSEPPAEAVTAAEVKSVAAVESMAKAAKNRR